MSIRQCKARKDQRDTRLRRVEKLESRLLMAGDIEFRSFDGSGNNQDNEDWGAANTQLLRLTTVEYGPGNSGDFPSMAARVDFRDATINPRTVSNLLFDQDASRLNDRGLTSFVFQWGQFLDHDMGLTEDFAPVGVVAVPGEDMSFTVPTDGTESELPSRTVIPMLRSRFELDENGIAQQINQITSFIDASNIYGSDHGRAANLRARFGGFLLTSDGVSNVTDGTGHLLPFNFEVDGEFLENAAPPTTGTGMPLDPDDLFVAGDVRCNEQPGLTTMHTLYVLEHNYQARRIAAQLGLDENDLAEPAMDEYVYQLARTVVGAELQSITYNEFLPSLLGPDQLGSYAGYRDHVNPSIANVFSAALYRVGHTMLPNELLLLNEDGTPVPDDPDVLGASVENGEVALGEAFFNPALITDFGIEPYLKGLATQRIQELDNLMVDGVRNLLFDPPAAFDLGATNLQRGRDHGLADYNQIRVDFRLDPVTSFAEIASDFAVVAALEAAYDAANTGVNGYDAINNIDVFAGAVSEDHIPGGSVGELLQTVLVDQFTRLRDGDRFYYENVFHGASLEGIQNTRLSDIIRRNTNLQDIPDEVLRGDSVLTFRAREGRGRVNVTLRIRGDELQVVKGNRIVAAQDLGDTSIVVIYGTSQSDTIRIDGSVAASFEGSVELHGGGGFDRLVVKGTSTADEVVVAATEVRVNDLSVFYGNFEKMDVQTAGGDDRASVAGLLNASLTLAGGRGNDILIGSPGNDKLVGGPGRDILVGRAGSDTLFGRLGEDILVAGEANADFAAVQAVWTSELSYRRRVAILRDEISSEDDGVRDYLFGGLGRDWFLFNSLDIALARFFGEAVH